MNYKEKLWDGEPKSNPYKVGDKVNVYCSSMYFTSAGHHEHEGTVYKIQDEILYLDKPECSFPAHFRQCRLLEEVKPNEIWIRQTLQDNIDPRFLRQEPPDSSDSAIWKKYREVIDTAPQ